VQDAVPSNKSISMRVDMNKVCCIDAHLRDDLTRTVEFLNVIAEENRLKILCILLNHGEKCVCEIWQQLSITQNLASHHLKVLKDFGLLRSRKDGLNVFYAIDYSFIKKYKDLLDRLLVKRELV
jgi:ArsR family transcriptional regulator